jgi:glycosyltransferase involved in cell wall biosynthesis
VKLLGVPPERVHVIYQGVDPTFRPAGTGEIERVTAKFGLDQPYLLFVGSIAPRKNLAAAVAAFGLVKRRLAAALTMAIVGVNSFQFPKMDVPTDATEGVRAIGYADDDDLPGLYAGAEALVYPSLYEGFGLPPLEAMACGTPVVTSDCSSLPEVVGDAALMVDPTDVEGLAEATYKILADKEFAEELRRRGLERAKLFSWNETASRMLEVCRWGRDSGKVNAASPPEP